MCTELEVLVVALAAGEVLRNIDLPDAARSAEVEGEAFRVRMSDGAELYVNAVGDAL